MEARDIPVNTCISKWTQYTSAKRAGEMASACEVSHDRRVPYLHLLWQPVPPAPGLHPSQPPDPGSVSGMYIADAAGEGGYGMIDRLIPLEKIIVDLRAMDGTWCSHPYPGHPHGCPNFMRGCTNRPAFNDPVKGIGIHYTQWFAVLEEFNLDAHAVMMKKKHPGWSERQCKNPLYWQGGVRKRLKEKAWKLHPQLKDWGHIYVSIPESWGVNVFETMRLVGVIIDQHPHIVKKVAFIGVVP
jgi:hypothetical protein